MGVKCQERDSKERKRKRGYSARKDEGGLDPNSTTMINLRKKVSSLEEKKEMSKERQQV